MKRPTIPSDSRAEELLVDRALYGSSEAEAVELRELGLENDTSFDEAAAAAQMAALRVEPMPPQIMEKILAAAPRAAAVREVPVPAQQKTENKHVRAPATFGWLAAAACLALAATSWVWNLRRPPEVRVVQVPSPQPSLTASAAKPPPTVAEERAQIANAKDALHLDWKQTKDPSSTSATGDVVWSASLQRGFMRFVGLEPNDKAKGQYQLWIFDRDRDARYPVDGGVFDVASNGEVIVPISSKLRVDDATLFAVTFEKPGGVVVSKRERMIVTAAVPPG